MNNEREKQMMAEAETYAAKMCDESSTGAQVAEIINDFCAGWRAADSHTNRIKQQLIDKACEWLENNAYLYVEDIDQLHESALIGDIREAMEE